MRIRDRRRGERVDPGSGGSSGSASSRVRAHRARVSSRPRPAPAESAWRPGRRRAAPPSTRSFRASPRRSSTALAYAPSYAPIQVQRAIWAGDLIRKKPYCYGGGHGSWNDSCYDCSGSVSYVLHAAGSAARPRWTPVSSCLGASAGPGRGSRSTRTPVTRSSRSRGSASTPPPSRIRTRPAGVPVAPAGARWLQFGPTRPPPSVRADRPRDAGYESVYGDAS